MCGSVELDLRLAGLLWLHILSLIRDHSGFLFLELCPLFKKALWD